MYTSIRTVTYVDMKVWALLAHQYSDTVLRELAADINVFYNGFEAYMERKIQQNEVFMAIDPVYDECMGIVAFSRTNNRITFFAVADKYDFVRVGSELLMFTLSQLDSSRSVYSTVFKSTHERVVKETQLYEMHGFKSCEDTVEAGVSALLMVRLAR